MIDWSPSSASTALFACGWVAGWLLWRRAKLLPSGTTNVSGASPHRANDDTHLRRPAVSIVVPCRNEASNVTALLASLREITTLEDEIIVVDDASTDATAALARAGGATVVTINDLPSGWAGKPFACWQGARVATREVLVFLDADVRLGATSLESVCEVVARHPGALVSVMPWHRTHGVIERLSMLFNVVSSLVASVASASSKQRVAYGPYIAVHRASYEQIGGHSHPNVRGAVVEDLALARAMPKATALIGRRGLVEYRMYPAGLAQLVEGWTKDTATGAFMVPRPSALLIIAWITSLCGGLFASPWFYLASVVQVFVMARRVGNFGVVSAVLYPLHAVFFVAVALWSLVRSGLVGSVSWRGRRIATR